MAINLVTYAASTVTPQDDALIYENALIGSGMIYGGEVTIKSANVLHVAAGHGALCGRKFTIEATDIPISLTPSGSLLGRIYIHMDLSDVDEPISFMVETSSSLTPVIQDSDININNGVYEINLATFEVDTSTISNLVNVAPQINNIEDVLENVYQTSDPTENAIDNADYIPFFDTSANKKKKIAFLNLSPTNKADKSDLASISITGTENNTGATITSGTYFYLNDSLVRALADIANNATLTLNTNYETITAGVLNTLNKYVSVKDNENISLSTAVASYEAFTFPSNGTYLVFIGGIISVNGMSIYATPHQDGSGIFDIAAIGQSSFIVKANKNDKLYMWASIAGTLLRARIGYIKL